MSALFLFLCAVSLKRHCKCNFFALKVHGSSPPLLWKCSCFSGQIWFWKCWVWGEGKSRVPGEKSLRNIELIMERFRVLENKQIKTAQNKSYGWNSREPTNFCAEVMNSKRQENGKLGHVVQIPLPFAVNVILNLSNNSTQIWHTTGQ